MKTYKKKKIKFHPLKSMVNHSIIVTLKRKKFLTCNLLAGYIHEEVNIMNKYESVVIIDPAVAEEKVKELSQKFTDIINNDGKVEKVEELGKKRLAYEVKKNKEGYYVVINFEANPELISELERNYRIMDEVIKFITKNVRCKNEQSNFNGTLNKSSRIRRHTSTPQTSSSL